MMTTMDGQPKQHVRWRLIGWFATIAFIIAAIAIDRFIDLD